MFGTAHFTCGLYLYLSGSANKEQICATNLHCSPNKSLTLWEYSAGVSEFTNKD